MTTTDDKLDEALQTLKAIDLDDAPEDDVGYVRHWANEWQKGHVKTTGDDGPSVFTTIVRLCDEVVRLQELRSLR